MSSSIFKQFKIRKQAKKLTTNISNNFYKKKKKNFYFKTFFLRKVYIETEVIFDFKCSELDGNAYFGRIYGWGRFL